MSRGTWKSLSSPRIAGVQWSDTVRSTLWGHGVRRGGRPGCHPWPCRDRAGVLWRQWAAWRLPWDVLSSCCRSKPIGEQR